MILIIKHIAIEGPGTLGQFFDNSKCETETVELYRGDGLPGDFSSIKAVVTLGGPMNVYQEREYPFLKEEDFFLKEALRKNVPVLGICLGAQLLAKACNGTIKKAENREIGWYDVSLTAQGRGDLLFKGVKERLDVFQWHGDTFDLPQGCALLATSPDCKNQAFRFGSNAYGLQFHIEVTADMVEDWIKEYCRQGDIESRLRAKDMVLRSHYLREGFNRERNKIYSNFLKILSA